MRATLDAVRSGEAGGVRRPGARRGTPVRCITIGRNESTATARSMLLRVRVQDGRRRRSRRTTRTRRPQCAAISSRSRAFSTKNDEATKRLETIFGSGTPAVSRGAVVGPARASLAHNRIKQPHFIYAIMDHESIVICACAGLRIAPLGPHWLSSYYKCRDSAEAAADPCSRSVLHTEVRSRRRAYNIAQSQPWLLKYSSRSNNATFWWPPPHLPCQRPRSTQLEGGRMP